MVGNGSEETRPAIGSVGIEGVPSGSEIASSGNEGNAGDAETINPERAAADLRERVGSLRGTEPGYAEGGREPGPAADPAAPYGRHPDGTPRKRRPYAARGTGGARAAQEKDKASIRGIEKLLYSLHQMGAVFLSAPELELDATEARDLANAVRDVQEHYSVSISPKAEAWANLAVVALGLYGTRAIAIGARRSQERKEKREAEKAKKRDEQKSPEFVPTHLASHLRPVGGSPIG